jgi:hypothetical protein
MSMFPGSNAESAVARQEAEVGPLDPSGPSAPATGPALRGAARTLFQLAGLIAVVGVVLALAVPIGGLSSTSCQPFDCGLVQRLGKVFAAGGIGVALTTLAFQSLRNRQFSAAIMATLVAGPALLMAVLIVDEWRQIEAGTDMPTVVGGLARDYAAARGLGPAAELRPLIYNGRGDWLSVRLTGPGGATSFVLLQRQAGAWTPRAVAPTFTKEELRALGAPTDLLNDPS